MKSIETDQMEARLVTDEITTVTYGDVGNKGKEVATAGEEEHFGVEAHENKSVEGAATFHRGLGSGHRSMLTSILA
ncbi:hypothetical protein FPRO04_13264 [Fusarium proliferatum]|nr:hypothetical protein FPRO04_13264 [Fusarium proliferatum]